MMESPTSEAAPTSTSVAQSENASTDVAGIDDPEFLSSLLGAVDVDMNDPLIQAALAQLSGNTSADTTSTGDKPVQKRKHGDEGDGNDTST